MVGGLGVIFPWRGRLMSERGTGREVSMRFADPWPPESADSSLNYRMQRGLPLNQGRV